MTILQIRLALAVNKKGLKEAMASNSASLIEGYLTQRSTLKDMLASALTKELKKWETGSKKIA